jgi:putative ABC transport system permease protein
MTAGQAYEDTLRAGRGLARARGFTLAAVLTLALGMAGTVVMAALVEGILLRPLPVPDEGRLLIGWKQLPTGAFQHWPFGSREIDAIARESRLLGPLAGVSYYGAGRGIVFENGHATYLSGASVTGAFFEVVGVEPLLGRVLRPADDVPGAENVLVITHALWQRRYGGAPDVLGRRLTIGDRPFSIVGVMPPDFDFPRGVEAWMTLAADASTQTNAAFREGILRDVDLVARLRPGTSLDAARAELQGLVASLEKDASPESPRGLKVLLLPLRDVVVGDVRPAMLALLAAVFLLLLIASANVANLLLLRGEGRRTELAVRAALGAGRGRLCRQLLAESLLLSLAAGLLALAGAPGLLGAVIALVPGGLPRVESVRIDPLVMAATLGVALAAAALAGVVPALLASRVDLASQLRTGHRAGTGTGVRRGRRALVTAQVALAVTVVAAAALLARSLRKLETVDMGMAAHQLVFVDFAAVEKAAAPSGPEHAFDDLVEALKTTPGIDGVTPVHTLPYAGTGGWDLPVFTAEGQSREEARANPSLNLESVAPGYFATLGIPLRRGRAFAADDRAGAPEVAIVSEDVAARSWPGQDPIGRRLKFGEPQSKYPWRTVVGVAKTTRYRELARPRPTLYVPASQFIAGARLLVLRTSLSPPAVADLVRARARAVAPGLEVTRAAPFSQVLAEPLARPRFNSFLIGLFGVASLLLATIGLYAVMGTFVRQRHPEIGVRIALGASPADVRRLVVGEGLRLAAAGAAVGLLGAAAAARVLRGLLFGVAPLDPLSLVGAAVLLVGVSALASCLPARRAARVDPVSVLRSE